MSVHRARVGVGVAAILGLVCLPPREARAAQGGPDSYGYTFHDEADGAIYNYVDITATGMEFQPRMDEALGGIVLAAPFTFYGVDFTDLEASTNGFLTLSAAMFADSNNECVLPDPTDPINPRIELNHDDLQTRIFYQYFDAVAAAAVGYPGETDGISVIQWTGDHVTPIGPPEPLDEVDMELVLFHGSGEILAMLAADPSPGLGTTGLGHPGSGSGLLYTCQFGGPLTPGVTAVRFVPPGAPGVCGDGVVAANEQCDDAGESAACDPDCTFAACGDAFINVTAGEECDEGDGNPRLPPLPPPSPTCDLDCTFVVCGDATVNPIADEECDDGMETATCDDDCTPAECGDGHVNAAAGEVCDDGNTMAGDGCAPDCSEVIEPGDSGGSGDTADGSTGDPAGTTTSTSGGSDESPASTSDVSTSGTGDDTGSAPMEDGSGDGCACTSGAGSTSAGPWWWLLSLVVARRRPSTSGSSPRSA